MPDPDTEPEPCCRCDGTEAPPDPNPAHQLQPKILCRRHEAEDMKLLEGITLFDPDKCRMASPHEPHRWYVEPHWFACSGVNEETKVPRTTGGCDAYHARHADTQGRAR